MNQQPDKFFREKLKNHERAVQSGAWHKLEAGLDRKNDKRLWLRIAASLLCIAIASYLLLQIAKPKSVHDKSQSIAKNKMEIPLPEGMTRISSADSSKIYGRLTKWRKYKHGAEQPMNAATELIDEDPIQSDVALTAKEKDTVVNEDQLIDTLPVESFSRVSQETPSAVNVSGTKRRQTITLIYTIEEVNEKFLEKESFAEATVIDKKRSVLKKLLNKASDLTRDQDPMGELRQKKDEILALNFKKKNDSLKTNKPL